MIPSGHTLSHPLATCGAFTARCRCGIDVWGLTLPQMWERHDRHLAAVRAQSQANHPSGGQ